MSINDFTFTGVGVSPEFSLDGPYTASVSGLVGSTVQLQQKDGARGEFVPLEGGEWAINSVKNGEAKVRECKYRFECLVYGSGTITCTVNTRVG